MNYINNAKSCLHLLRLSKKYGMYIREAIVRTASSFTFLDGNFGQASLPASLFLSF